MVKRGMRALSVILSVLVATAGCSGGGGAGDPAQRPGGGPPVHGWTATSDIGEARDSAATDIYAVDVDVNGSAAGIATWEEDGDAAGSVWVAWRRGGAWEAPAMLSDAATHALHPRVALNDAGQAVVAWETIEHAGVGIVGRSVWARRWMGGAWLAAERLSEVPSAPNALFAWRPRVGIDAAGRALVSWDQQKDLGASTVQASRFDGAAWGAPSPVSVGTTAAAWSDVAVSTGGRAAVVWVQDTNPYDPNRPGGGPSNPTVRARVLSDGTWSDPQVLCTTLADFEGTERPRVVLDAGGRSLAVWEEHRAANAIVAATLDPAPATTWGAPSVLASSPSATDHLSFPEVAAGGGAGLAAWWRDVPGTGQVNAAAARLAPGAAGWSAPFDFDTGGSVGGVAVAVDGSGTGWLFASSTAQAMTARRLGAAGALEAPTALGAGTVRGARANAGGAVLVGSQRWWFGPPFLVAAGGTSFSP